MLKYNISKPEKYTKDGVEKTFWANVGTMTEFQKPDGNVSRIIEIPAIGLKASVFLQEAKEESRVAPAAPARTAPAKAKPLVADEKLETIEYPEEDINPDDIPF